MKKIFVSPLVLITSLLLLSCEMPTNNITPIKYQNNLKNTKEHFFRVSNSKKGSNIVVEIDTRNISFSTKATSNGIIKTAQDIKSYEIYLIKNSYANSSDLVSDPIANDINNEIIQQGTFNTDARISEKINFSNVPPPGSGKYYYVGVRAFDNIGGASGVGNDLIAPGNEDPYWTSAVALSPVGISIDSNVTVSNLSIINVIPKLITSLTAKVDTDVVLTGAKSLIKSYKAYLCTNNADPTGTMVWGSVNIDSNDIGSYLTNNKDKITLTLSNITGSGIPLYAVVDAYAGTNATGLKLSNTSGISSSTVSVNASQVLTFSSSATNPKSLNITLPIQTGLINTIGGNGTAAFSDNAIATNGNVNLPTGIAIDSSRNLYIADTANHRIRKIDIDGSITTIAGTGTGTFSGDGGLATSATINNPNGLAVDKLGNIYIADTSNNRIRKIDASSGNITTIAGTGTPSFSGDSGLATSATINNPNALTLDSLGNIYIADTINNRIRKIDVSSGNITTIAGIGTGAFSGDSGQAGSAEINNPKGLALDASDNIYIADTSNSRIRRIDFSTGIITTVAGTGSASFSGDGGLATSATINNPNSLSIDKTGNIYIADTTNHRIRRIDFSSGNITTVVGSSTGGSFGASDFLQGTSSILNLPSGVAVDSSSNIYLADTSNNRIRKIFMD
ncbi:MAG: NHL repeat-containing protein [Cyanobacteriota bacterium]